MQHRRFACCQKDGETPDSLSTVHSTVLLGILRSRIRNRSGSIRIRTGPAKFVKGGSVMSWHFRSTSWIAVVVLAAALIPIFGCPTSGVAPGGLSDRVEALETALAAVQSELSDAQTDLAANQADLASTQADLASTQSELAGVASDLASAQANLATTQANLAEAKAKLAYVEVVQGAMDGLNGPHLIIEGCNVHVRSGSGETDDGGSLTGLGNLIVGYNEAPPRMVYGRLGSHNLVVGQRHEYSSYGGFVAGEENTVAGTAASVSGGLYNDATDAHSSVSGGELNSATDPCASVSGGFFNNAGGTHSSVSGGEQNGAYGQASSVSGGKDNYANFGWASVSGGRSRVTYGDYDWVAGSLREDN